MTAKLPSFVQQWAGLAEEAELLHKTGSEAGFLLLQLALTFFSSDYCGQHASCAARADCKTAGTMALSRLEIWAAICTSDARCGIRNKDEERIRRLLSSMTR